MALGVGVPWVAIKLERTRYFSATAAYEPLNAFAIGLVVLSLALLTHANVFLAAFAAGVTVATMSPAIRAAFHQFGELVAELLKLAALLVFGALISPAFLGDIGISGYVFAAAGPRSWPDPSPSGWPCCGSPHDRQGAAAAAWFGPKGFASVVYALLILEAGLALSDELFHLAALVVTASILAHSSTDVLVARWFEEPADEETDLALSEELPGRDELDDVGPTDPLPGAD